MSSTTSSSETDSTVGSAAPRPVLMRIEGVSKRFSRQVRASFRHTIEDIVSQLTGRHRRPRTLRGDEFWALREVSLEIRQGELVAVIGDNGAGKSTLVKLLMGRMLPTVGRISTQGSISALTVLGLGFDPVLTGRENIFLNAATLGMAHKQTAAMLDKIIAFAEIDEFIDAPVQSYSSGMRARLGYAVAAHVNPEILLLDEVLAVGDLHFRRKCRTHIKKFIESGGTVVLVTHDLQAVQTMCTRCVVLDHGRVVFDGDPVEGIHAYTRLRGQDDAESSDGFVGISPQEEPATAAEASDEPPPPANTVSEVGSGLAEDSPDPSASGSTADVAPPNGSSSAISESNHTPARTSESPCTAQWCAIVTNSDATAGPENPIVLESIAMRASSGDVVRSGAALELRLCYVSSENIARVAWGFTFCTEDGLTHIGSVLAGFGEDQYSITVGRGEFWCRIPRLPLRAGRYMLKAGIGDADTGAAIVDVGWETNVPVAFQVQSDPSALNAMHSIVGDLVLIDAEIWQTLPASTP